MMSLFSAQIGDHLLAAGTVSDLGPVCQTKESLVNNNYLFLAFLLIGFCLLIDKYIMYMIYFCIMY